MFCHCVRKIESILIHAFPNWDGQNPFDFETPLLSEELIRFGFVLAILSEGLIGFGFYGQAGSKRPVSTILPDK
jgi:hypothetical protein